MTYVVSAPPRPVLGIGIHSVKFSDTTTDSRTVEEVRLTINGVTITVAMGDVAYVVVDD